MSYDPADARAAQEHFGFARPAPIEKDWHILRAMRAIVGVDSGPFRLVFAGGTCLARAHKLVYRMSEDVDFKIAPVDCSPVSKSKRRKELGNLRDRITESLRAAGFLIDPKDSAQLHSRDDNRYTLYQLPYEPTEVSGVPLRSAIQVELNYVALRLPVVRLPVASFIAEAFGRSPELEDIACVSVDETAGEKLVSLTRRTAMELAGLGHGPDPTLVRHIYDLHITRAHYDPVRVVKLAREIVPLDAEEFANQFPAYHDNPMEETQRALAALVTDARYSQRYTEFLELMVYGDKPRYEEAMKTVSSLVHRLEAPNAIRQGQSR